MFFPNPTELPEPPARCLPPPGEARDLSEPPVAASELLGHAAARPAPTVEHPFFSVMLALNLLGDADMLASIDAARRGGRSWSVTTQNGIMMASTTGDGSRLVVSNERCADLSFVLPPLAGAPAPE